MFIKPLEVHLWHIPLSGQERQQAIFFSHLSQDDQKRANRFYYEIHRQRFIVAHYALRDILSRYLLCSPKKLQFDSLDKGKPSLISQFNSTHIEFNLSHSAELAILAITLSQPIGVDLEKLSDLDKLAIAKRFFANSEYEQLCQLDKQQQKLAFFHIWTQKEAFIKCLGKGLVYPLQQFAVAVNKPASLKSINDPTLPKHWQQTSSWWFHDFIPHDNYQACVVTPQKIIKYSYWQWPIVT